MPRSDPVIDPNAVYINRPPSTGPTRMASRTDSVPPIPMTNVGEPRDLVSSRIGDVYSSAANLPGSARRVVAPDLCQRQRDADQLRIARERKCLKAGSPDHPAQATQIAQSSMQATASSSRLGDSRDLNGDGRDDLIVADDNSVSARAGIVYPRPAAGATATSSVFDTTNDLIGFNLVDRRRQRGAGATGGFNR